MGHARQPGQSGKLQMDFTNLPDAADATITGTVYDTVTVALRQRVFGTNGTPLSKTQVENTRVILTPIPV